VHEPLPQRRADEFYDPVWPSPQDSIRATPSWETMARWIGQPANGPPVPESLPDNVL